MTCQVAGPEGECSEKCNKPVSGIPALVVLAWVRLGVPHRHQQSHAATSLGEGAAVTGCPESSRAEREVQSGSEGSTRNRDLRWAED